MNRIVGPQIVPVEMKGADSLVVFGQNITAVGGAGFSLGSHSSVRIADGCVLGALQLRIGDNVHVTIGAGTGFVGRGEIATPEPATISIGAGCLFADDIKILPSDFHGVFDLETGERINLAKDIVIGDRVWCGLGVTILKGVTVGPNSVIGLGAVVTRDIPANCLASGNPARVVKTSIFWGHRL